MKQYNIKKWAIIPKNITITDEIDKQFFLARLYPLQGIIYRILFGTAIPLFERPPLRQ